MRIKIFITVFLLLFIIHNSYLLNPVFALDSTQSATQSADFKSKLKALQEEIASRASNLKLEISQRLQNRAYVGLIKTKETNALTLGGERQIIINEYTEFSGSSKGKINLKSLIKDDYIAALGDVDDKEVLTAKKIIKFTAASFVERKTFYGQVVSIDGNNINIKTKDNPNIVITVNSNTAYQSGKISASLENIAVGKTIIAITNPVKENIFKARFVYILSQGINFKPKNATSSAKAATPAAEVKKKN